MTTALCGCGCGRDVGTYTRTDTRAGHVKGQPMRYVRGHSARACVTMPGSSAEAFWSLVDKNGPISDVVGTPCWIWRGAADSYGYGVLAVPGSRPRVWKAHRRAWFLETGKVPSEHLLHHCDNPPCVNRSHLFEGSQADNVHDMTAKGRQARGAKLNHPLKTHCKRGHAFTAGNTYHPPATPDARQCRACKRFLLNRWRERARTTT